MSSLLIRNATIVNEGKIFEGDVFIKDDLIFKIGSNLKEIADLELDATSKILIPGVIDDQVHFREPGMTHKGEIFTESKAAIAGGVTSYMEMPNTFPQALTQELLEQKYEIGARRSFANYSFFMGASNHNLEEVLKTDAKNVCGLKIFMGSSTGDMLVDDETVLDAIFKNCDTLIATHCEKEEIVRANLKLFKEKYGEHITPEMHPQIRNEEACYQSSKLAVELAKKYNTRLHVLHISTAKEVSHFSNELPLEKKRITAEACIHHLWFSDEDYAKLGNLIKWNPAIKTKEDRDGIWKGLLENKIDIIATDHAPHTSEEKSYPYLNAPSGGPLIQHGLVAMLECVHNKKISLERMVEKMCHAPAQCFNVSKRGFIREGYFADLVLVDLNDPWTVAKDNLLYKCGWSPFEGQKFKSKVTHTILNGELIFADGKWDELPRGRRLTFDR